MKTFLITLLFLSTYLNSNAQKQSKTYAINVNNKDYSEKIEVLDSKATFTASQGLSYYWYSSNKVISTVGGYDGRLMHGQYTSFYLNNNLKEKGSFFKGLKNGIWIRWFPTGTIMEIISWKKGLRNGQSKIFDEKGNLILKENYKNGKLNGYAQTFQDGKLLTEKKYKKGIEIIKVEKIKKTKKKWFKSRKNKESEGIPVEKKSFASRLKKLFKKNDAINNRKNKTINKDSEEKKNKTKQSKEKPEKTKPTKDLSSESKKKASTN